MATATLVEPRTIVQRMKLRTQQITAPAKAKVLEKQRLAAERLAAEEQRRAEEELRRPPLVIICTSSRERAGFGHNGKATRCR